MNDLVKQFIIIKKLVPFRIKAKFLAKVLVQNWVAG